MRKLFVPLSISRITDENLHVYLDQLKQCKATRVFLCGMGEVFREDSIVYTQNTKIKKLITVFQKNGYP